MLASYFLILGLVVGSFLNVVIWRLHSNESVVFGRSHCPHCRHDLAIGDLLPLLSFALLGGRCRYCRGKISWQYPAVEAITGLLFLLVYWLGGGWLALLSHLIAVSALVVIFVYDWRWQEIPDEVTLPAIAIILLLNWLANPLSLSFLIAAIAGAIFFAVQYYFSDGRWVGGGDIRLGALTGAILGWPSCLVAIFLAYLSGAGVGLYLLARKKATGKTALPFGTFIAPATIITMLWGPQIIHWYFLFVRMIM